MKNSRGLGLGVAEESDTTIGATSQDLPPQVATHSTGAAQADRNAEVYRSVADPQPAQALVGRRTATGDASRGIALIDRSLACNCLAIAA